MKKELKVVKFYFEKGVGFYFQVPENCIYTVLFKEIKPLYYMLEFNRTKKLDRRYLKYYSQQTSIRKIICNIIAKFLDNFPERIICAIYDDDDFCANARFKLFNKWFYQNNYDKNYLKLDIETQEKLIVTIIMSKQNKLVTENVLTESSVI